MRPSHDVEMMRSLALGGDVVLVEPPTGVVGAEDHRRLAHREPLQVRDADLDHEAAPRLEVSGSVAKALDLGPLCSPGS